MTDSLDKLTEIISCRDFILFDNDGVTYPITQEVLDTYAIAVARAAQDLIPELSIEEGVKLAWDSWNKYRYSLQIFHEIYGVDIDDMHNLYHNYCDASILEADAALPSGFEKFRLPRAMLTHGNRDWTYRVLEHLNIRKHFPDGHIYAIEEVGFMKKSDTSAPFEYVLEQEGYRADLSIIVEDSVANIVQAKKLGMTTVLVTNGRYFEPHSAVDFTVRNLNEFLSAASGLHPSVPAKKIPTFDIAARR